MVKYDITNVDIILFALYRLGGIAKKIHTEYIAWESYKLAPERFSWENREFKDKGFPDKDLVRVTLTNAMKEDYGSLVKGRTGVSMGGKESDGWMFTPVGVQWIKDNEKRIAETLEQKTSTIHPRELDRFLRKTRKDEAFILFQEDSNLDRVTAYMFTDMLGCTPDASKEIMNRKFERLLSIAVAIGDKPIISFFEQCRGKFSSLLGR